jgi:hypothetical protein
MADSSGRGFAVNVEPAVMAVAPMAMLTTHRLGRVVEARSAAMRASVRSENAVFAKREERSPAVRPAVRNPCRAYVGHAQPTP